MAVEKPKTRILRGKDEIVPLPGGCPLRPQFSQDRCLAVVDEDIARLDRSTQRGIKNCFDTENKLWYLLFMLNSIRKGLVLPLVLSLMLLPVPLSAAEAAQDNTSLPQASEPSSAEDLGYGVGSVLASMFYSPFKLTYAGLGLVTGGLGYVLSAGNTDVANNIINPAIRGNYVVTPGHLKGEEPLVFVGPAPAPEPSQPQQAPSAALPQP